MTKEKLPLPAASFILQLILVMNLLLQILNRFEIIPHRKYLLASMSLLLFIFSVWEFRKVFLVHDFFIGLILLYCLLYYRFVSQIGHVGMLSSLPYLLIGYSLGLLFRYSDWSENTFIIYVLLGFLPFFYGFFIKGIDTEGGYLFAMNRNTISALLIPAISLHAISSELKEKRYILMFPSLINLLFAYLSKSRAGLLLSILLATVILIRNISHWFQFSNRQHPHNRLKKLLAFLLAGILLLAGFFSIRYLLVHSRFSTEGLSSNGRFEIFSQFVSELSIKKLVFGFRPSVDKKLGLHNSYLTMLSFYGIMAFVFIALIIFALIKFAKSSVLMFGMLLIWGLYSLVESISPLDIGDQILIPLLMIAYPPKRWDIVLFPFFTLRENNPNHT